MRIEIDKDEYKNLTEMQEEFIKTVKKLENIIIENIKLKDKLQAKEQECENLKEKIAQIKCEEIGKETFFEYKIKNYKQVLDEIEGYCNKYPTNSIGFKQSILDIINKTKVGE